MLTHDVNDVNVLKTSRTWIAEFVRKTNWPTLICGVAMGLFLMQMLVVRSFNHRMDEMSTRVAQTRQQVSLLTGSSDDVAVTNDLLARLAAQKTQIRTANDSLVELQRLRSQIERDSGRLDEAVTALEQLTRIQNELVSRAPQMDQAVRTMDTAITLQGKVAEMGRNLPNQTAGLSQAQEALSGLAQLKRQALNEQVDLDRAKQQLESAQILINGLVASAEKLIQARTTASELVSLKDQLVVNSDGLDRSQNAVNNLVGMQEQLAGVQVNQLANANKNLTAMIDIQNRLSQQTTLVAENVEGLDIMLDFQVVLSDQLQSMENIRRQLTDLVLMESTLVRAARVLAPLTELASVRGLRDDQQIREAARRILDRRLDKTDRTQVAERLVEEEAVTIPVPAPTEEN